MDDDERESRVPAGLAQEFEDQPWPLVGFATTEHNNLVALRADSVAETNGRSAAYLGTLSAALVALGVIGNEGFGRPFFAFGMLVLFAPALVGVLTFARSLQSSVEDLRLVRRIEQVRSVYVQLLPNLGKAFEPPVVGGPEIVRYWAGARMTGPWQLFLTLAGLIGTVNSLVFGVLVGFAAELAGVRSWLPVLVGGVCAVAALAAHIVVQVRAFR